MYDMPLYRPPSEAYSLIFQVTLGCSFNQCAFCSMYRTKSFAIRPLGEVLGEIRETARVYPDARRIFLADGDALACPTEHLEGILKALYGSFPKLTRVTCYALPGNLLRKSVEELAGLRERGLTMIYYGIESGSQEILKRITKGATPRSMITSLEKAREARLKVSATVVLGLGGKSRWQEHIDGTVALVNQVPLNYLSTLQVYLEPVVQKEFPEKFARLGGVYEPQDDMGILAEQARFVAGVDPPSPVIFRANHASNALPLKGILPRDRDKLLAMLGAASEGEVVLRPLSRRGL
uniref:Radical SAM superfamily protein n=1 Tax=Candidatus Kentrum sp. FM TaxID=2126340 RepID=A0A450WB12_9GAMM|nr:MAG: Radical SAM superfamily protein [Candidatus Kentron sp. FM]VFJ63484.1 MAG: Radical SAM superfamily protein [Candidatus Kentron sp. FM]VFK14243.1 MAG: Radical SAM superfamily protein [Candidatus Kentron sp. FM]